MTERALRSAHRSTPEGYEDIVKVRQDIDDLRQEVVKVETEQSRCQLVRKHETLEYLKRSKHWDVFGGLEEAKKTLRKVGKLLPITDDNLGRFLTFRLKLQNFLTDYKGREGMVLRYWERCQRRAAEDKLIEARIKKEKAAEKALAKKRKRDK
jgi:hypothetical protein